MKKIVLLIIWHFLIYGIFPSDTFAQKIEPVWNFSDFNSDPTSKGLEFSDLDNDGRPEVIMGNEGKIYVLRLTDTPYVFDRFELNCFNYRIGDFTLADDDQDGDTEIFAVNLRGEVLRLDVEGDEITEEVIGDTDIVEPGAIAVADLNKDGLLEYIIGPKNGFFSKGLLTIYHLYGPQWLHLVQSYPVADVEEIELADINGDTYLDIIQTPLLHNRSLVIDGKTFKALHDGKFFSGLSEVADVDGNGTMEIVNVEKTTLRIFDALSMTLINSFELKVKDGAESLHVAEIDERPGLEALVGSNPLGTGDLYCYNILTGALLWEKNNIAQSEELSNICTFDIDGDGATEIVFGALGYGVGVLVSMDIGANSIEHESLDFRYSVVHRVNRFADNGNHHLFLLTNEFRDAQTVKILREFSLDNFKLLKESVLTGNVVAFNRFDIANMRSPNEIEWVLSDQNNIYFIDPDTETEVLPHLSFDRRIHNLWINDTYQLGLSELIVLFNDGVLKTFKWTSKGYIERTSNGPIIEYPIGDSDVKTAQLDEDAALELVFSYGRELKIFDLSTFELQQNINNNIDFFGTVVVAASDKDKAPFIYTFSGSRIFKIDLLNEKIASYRTIGTGSYVEMAIGHFLSDEQEHLLVNSGNRVYFVDPGDLGIVQENKSIAANCKQISVIENRELGIDGFVLGTDDGAYFFQMLKLGSICAEGDLAISGEAMDNTIDWALHTLSSTATIPGGKIVQYKAGTKIHLLPGFSAQSQSQFKAKIETCADLPDIDIPKTDVLIYDLTPHPRNAFTIFPNPAGQTTKINWMVNRESEIYIDLYSMSGTLVRNIVAKVFREGEYALDINLSELDSGMYVLVMQSNDLFQAKKVVVHR